MEEKGQGSNVKTAVIIAVVVIIIVVAAVVILKSKKGTEDTAATQATEQAQAQGTTPGEPGAAPSVAGSSEAGQAGVDAQTPAGALSSQDFKKLALEDAKKKYSKSRNIIMADPSMGAAEKKAFMDKINLAYRDAFGDLPPETPQDKADQVRIEKRIMQWKTDLASLQKSNLSPDDRRAKIKTMLDAFIKDVDGPQAAPAKK